MYLKKKIDLLKLNSGLLEVIKFNNKYKALIVKKKMNYSLYLLYYKLY